jgi:hypothetical protein
MHNKTKPIDAEKLLCNIPDEDKLPKRRSELYQLFKRLVRRHHMLGMNVKMSTYTTNDSDPNKLKELERALLTDKCLSLIRKLKDHINLHDLKD